jgi:hypothetical protein
VQAVEITRVLGDSYVEPGSKGWGSNENREEWKIVVRLTGEPNKAWSRAWESVTGNLRNTAPELDQAWWEFRPDEFAVEIWTTDEKAETVIRELDQALDRANRESAEIIRKASEFRAEQGQRQNDERAEAARLQEKLNSL